MEKKQFLSHELCGSAKKMHARPFAQCLAHRKGSTHIISSINSSSSSMKPFYSVLETMLEDGDTIRLFNKLHIGPLLLKANSFTIIIFDLE